MKENAHRRWIETHRQATLADLRAYLETVSQEIEKFDEDDLVTDHTLSDGTKEYLDDFGDDDVTFGERCENVYEDLDNLDDLIDLVGGDFRIRHLRGAA